MRYFLVSLVLLILLLPGCGGGNAEANVSQGDNYKYLSYCPARHDFPFYANHYEVLDGAIVLYDAYIFEWGWREVEVYKYPTNVAVSIERND